MSRKLIDMTGMVIGNLTVLRRAGNGHGKTAAWLCRCACGKECTAIGCNLRNGYTRSCGCLRRARFVDTLKAARDRYNARRSATKRVYEPGEDLGPLMDAARAALAKEWGKDSVSNQPE